MQNKNHWVSLTPFTNNFDDSPYPYDTPNFDAYFWNYVFLGLVLITYSRLSTEGCQKYVWAIKIQNSAERKIENVVPFQNGGQITDFYSTSFRFWPKFEKTLSQRNFFFNEIWLKVGERWTWTHLHYWNNIWKKIFRFKMAAKTTKARKRRGRFKFFFCVKRSVSDS